MTRSRIGGLVLLGLASSPVVCAQNQGDVPPFVESIDVQRARWIGSRDFAPDNGWRNYFFGSLRFFELLVGLDLWDTPEPFDPNEDVAYELDAILVSVAASDQDFVEEDRAEDIKVLYRVRGLPISIGPPQPPPLIGTTSVYITPYGLVRDPNRADLVRWEFSFWVPRIGGANQERLRGRVNYDVWWNIELRVANDDNPEEGSWSERTFPLYALQNPSLLPPNPPPFADAGSDVTVPAGTTVRLDGSKSFDSSNVGFDPNNPNVFSKDMLTYTWVWVSGPERVDPEPDPDLPSGSPYALVTLEALTTADNPYVYRLIVSDGSNALPSAAITRIFVEQVRADNRPPRAVITGPTGPVSVGSEVTLSGASSTDPDDPNGVGLTYRWRQTNALGGALTASELRAGFQPLSGVATKTSTWVATAAGTYYFQLLVTDAGGLASSARTSVRVVAAGSSTEQAARTSGSEPAAGDTSATGDAAQSGTGQAVPTAAPATGGCGAGALLPMVVVPAVLGLMRRRRAA